MQGSTKHDSSPNVSIAELREFSKVAVINSAQQDKYLWIHDVLTKFRYFRLSNANRSIIKKYLLETTDYSRVQLKRLIKRRKKTGVLVKQKPLGRRFKTVFTPEDIALLVNTDNAHGRLSGPATKQILQRAWEVFKDKAYERLSKISIAHIYNLRGKRQYVSHSKTFGHTQAVNANIGLRRKPQSDGKPGYLRVDSVHQGDSGEVKGVYHINFVDETTQWQIVGCAERISESFLIPVMEGCLDQFPFVIKEFHSDNGSEFINQIVAKLLNTLLIEQSKSRSRRTNDNALVEGKNGAVIRKWMGHNYIPGKFAEAINFFYKQFLNVYLNFHRPCGFSTDTVSSKGKIKKKYDTYLTPYEKFKSLENPNQYLRQGQTVEALDYIAGRQTDTQSASEMQEEKTKLFKSFR
ncbi:MAG: integrase [Patescibacteria group bacterium]